MNINGFNEIYEQNKKLDKLFIDKYYHKDFVKKNKLELLVEISELANETKCFKYWSNKSPDKKLIGYELADTIIMTLCFFNYLDIDMNDISIYKVNMDNIDLFFEIYTLAVSFVDNENKNILIKLFILLINMGYNLGFNDEDIISYCHNKIIKDTERISK